MDVDLVPIAEPPPATCEPLYVLLGAVGCVLLTACANVASLAISAATRHRKVVRAAIVLATGGCFASSLEGMLPRQLAP
jgi:hypothetical protein